MEMWNTYKILVRKRQGKNSWEDLDVDCRTILKWILEKYGLRVWLSGLNWLSTATNGGIFWALGSITERNILAKWSTTTF
jgi:hypothetical protein